MRRWMAILVLACASSAAAAPRVTSVIEKEAVPERTLTVRIAELNTLRCDALSLFVDGTLMRNLRATCSASEARFRLAVTQDTADAWHTLYGRARTFTRGVSISVGENAHEQLPTDVLQMPLRLVRPWRLVLTFVLTVIALAAIALLRIRTSLLTNLPRLQTAFFAVVVGASYGWLWSTTGELTTVNATALALIGIGFGTAIGSAAMGSATRVSVAGAAKNIANAAQNGVAAPVETQVRFGIHAVQAAVCTVVFGIVFLAHVYRNAEMPQFGGAELLLLGISGGTYVAFSFAKAPQNA